MEKVTIKIDYLKAVNYALHHNHVPVCNSMVIVNNTQDAIDNVEIRCTGQFIKTQTSMVAHLEPGKEIRIPDFNISPDAEAMLKFTERMTTSFVIDISSDGELIETKEFDIEMMPYDHWMGLSTLPQLVASFVTPNNPEISKVITKAGEIIEHASGAKSFRGYQSNDPNDVLLQVSAIWAALQQCGIVYRGMPPSYEDKGQRVTLPDQVLTSKLGNCIEITLLMASLLEAIEINSGIIFSKGHAYLAVWLIDNSAPYSFVDDPAFIEKLTANGINEMTVIECTMVSSQDYTLDDAIKQAKANLANHEVFHCFVDIKRCRLEKIYPLPQRFMENGNWKIDIKSIETDIQNIDVEEHDRYDLSHLGSNSRELTKYDIWERKLLDFSLRNTLLNLYLRKRAVQFISFDIDRIEDHLQDGEEYCIYPRPADIKQDTTERLFRSKLADDLRPLISDDIEHHRLHTYLSETDTQDVLKNIYRGARNAIEETGANSLFLSIGTVRWYESPQSDTPRFAPLLLLPVEMVYKKGQYYIRSRDEEITLNITLIEFLRQNHNITINSLNPLPKDNSGVDVKLIIAAVRDALREQKRWDVEEECLLGLFSFSKFLMWNDVHNNQQQLGQNIIVQSLVNNALAWTPTPVTGDLKNIDGSVTPSEIALPVPVDSSQMAAVIEGGKGNSFILYGPPGTGKSQTITNLIANALYHGKRVLFVAEKMAALSVVQSRLAKIGLDPFCLELHSNKASKRHVLEQLDKALHVAHIMSPKQYQDAAEKIYEQRKVLIEYMEALHNVDPADNMSLYDCIVGYEKCDGKPFEGFTHNKTLDDTIATGGIKAIEELLGSKLETVIKFVGQPSQHSLNGMYVSTDMLLNSGSLEQDLKRDAALLTQLLHDSASYSDIASHRQRLLRDNRPEIFGLDPDELYNSWRAAKAKWFIPCYFAKRKMVQRLRSYNSFIIADEVDALIDELMAFNTKKLKLSQLHSILEKYLGMKFEQDQMPDSIAVDNAATKLNSWSTHTSLMPDWVHWCEYSDTLRAAGLGCVVQAIETSPQDIAALRTGVIKALFKHKADNKISKSPVLISFAGMIFDEHVKSYKKLTEEFQLLTQKELYARLAANVPRVTDNTDNNSEIGVLNRNVSNGGRGMSMRDLFDKIPTLLPRLCPCMLMSPMSVAQYLDINGDKFDLVVFDEASQMPTSEAVGAIARGKSLIVVGDPKQMPPTSFFTSTNVDEDEASIDDMESILEDCRTLEMPSLQLNWHYRSRHESLIAFSNNEYYDGQLITFPSTDDQLTKVKYIPVSGYYDKGGKRTNKAEAQAIVSEIERRLKDKQQLSIGVISFSVVQQALIEDMLQELLDNNKELRETADAMYEPIFIKNLENVQGDERDVILFSVGYGPDKDGKVSMNFGPLNNQGGERRLNVAVSRARHEMMVFSTLKASHIDLRRSKARGVEGLKHFLEYAETQSLPTVASSSCRHCDLDLASIIAARLREKGFITSTGVGRSHFKVDIAMSDKNTPGIYKMGILLDGVGYRDTLTTRDREIVQPAVLESLHWKVMRLWSVDWYKDPQRALDRIVEAYNSEDATPQAERETQPAFVPEEEKIVEEQSCGIPYEAFSISPQQACALGDREIMSRIVDAEQPILLSTLCKRVATLRGNTKVTSKLHNDLKKHLHLFYQQPDLNGDVALWNDQTACMTYTSFRTNSGRNIQDIPLAEVKNVILETIRNQVAIVADNLMLSAAKQLGFTRRGVNVDAALNEAVSQLKRDGLIEEIDGRLRMAR